MWIVPSNISPCVRDMVESTSDLNELASLSEHSLMWRSKPSPVKTWYLRWKKGGLMSLLFGRILKPSLSTSFGEKWTSSQEGFLVSHLVEQDSDKELKTQDTCGLISKKVLENWGDLPLFSSRTSKESLVQRSTVNRFSNMSSNEWKAWVTKRRREYSVRAKLGQVINESVYSYSVSIQNSLEKDETLSPDSYPLQKVEPHIQQKWEESSIVLNPQEPCWATPTTRDWKGKYPKHSQEKNPRHLLPDQAHMGTYKGKLNPRWVETLMGLPIGWTSPEATQIIVIERTN